MQSMTAGMVAQSGRTNRSKARAAGMVMTSPITVSSAAGTVVLGLTSVGAMTLPLTNSSLIIGTGTGSAVLQQISGSSSGYVGTVSGIGGAMGIGNGGLVILSFNTSITVADGSNFVFNTVTGTKLGTTTTGKIGFWNATPIVQPAAAGQASITDSTTGTAGSSLVDVGIAFSQANVNNNFATVALLLLAIRTALVNSGLMKGAA